MEKNKTAVEWLVSQLNKQGFAKVVTDEEIQKAKEMEKQQIIDAHGDEQSHLQDDGSWRTVSAEQYYNEEYGK